MATTANKNNIVKRIDVSRKLTYLEMDTNFEELKLSIDDVVSVDDQLANKVDQSVYDLKILDIDASILDLENSPISESNIINIENDITAIDSRVSTNEFDITTIEADVAEALVPTWTAISLSTTLTENTYYAVDYTAGPLTLTLPATPAVNDFIKLYKNDGLSETSVIARNGNTIMGIAQDLTIDYEVTSIHFVFNGTDWRLV